jgi:probable addiction module antidote protein
MATKRKERFSRWDPADYMKSKEDIAAYIEACLEQAPESVLRQLSCPLGDVARATGMGELAKATGLTREGLYKRSD